MTKQKAVTLRMVRIDELPQALRIQTGGLWVHERVDAFIVRSNRDLPDLSGIMLGGRLVKADARAELHHQLSYAHGRFRYMAYTTAPASDVSDADLFRFATTEAQRLLRSRLDDARKEVTRLERLAQDLDRQLEKGEEDHGEA